MEAAGVLDRADRGRVLLRGVDRLSYLQGLLTNDVASLQPGTGCYAALLTPQGRMISDMRVFETGDSVLLDVPADLAPRVATHLSDFVFTEDVVVQDVTETKAHVTVLGRRAFQVTGVAPLRPFENRQTAVAGVAALVAGNDDFGVPGVDVFVDAAAKSLLLQVLFRAGGSPLEDRLAETLRIEAGRPRFGADMDHDTIPLEAGIEDRAISETKGCYVGQEIIIRVLHRGQGRVARKLVGLMFPSEGRVPARGVALYAGDRSVGSVTSAAWSAALQRPIALGYVHRDFTTPGTPLQAGETERWPVTVAALPLVNRAN